MTPRRLCSAALLGLALLLPALALAQSAVLDRIQKARSITIAFAEDALPFSYRGENREPAGYSIELCRRVVGRLQVALKLERLAIVWVGATTPERLKMVAAGKADLECGVTTHTLKRQELVEFSLPVFIDGAGVMVAKGSPIVAMPGLDGRKISVVGGTTTEARIREALKKRTITAELVLMADRHAAMAALDRGEVEAYAGDRGVLYGQALTTPTRTREWTLLNVDISYEPYAFAMPRGDPALSLAVNRALAAIYRGGEIEGVYERWLGRFGPPQQLLLAMYILNQIPE